MPPTLKRKLRDEAGSRKTRKVEDEAMSNVQDLNSDAEMDGGEDDEEVGSDGNEEEENEGEGTWGGIGGAQAHAGGHESGTKPKKPPTGEELRTIKDATDLFRSSSFKLQIDALLPNVRPKASRIPPLERFLLALHSVLVKIPSSSPQHPLEASRKLLKKGISVPYPLPLPTEETNWKVSFEKPSDITVVGSWPNKVTVKAKDGIPFGVDIAVEMPNELFQEKDYLNGRFFHKRAFYLASLAAAIINPKSGLNIDVSYNSLSDDPRLTKLVLVPRKDGSQTDFTKLNARVNIIPTLSQTSSIPLHRLSPSQSNLRVQPSTSSSSSSEAAESSRTPTPIYNTTLLTSLLPRPQLLATHSIKDEVPAFADALTLLRIWANQRGYGAGAEGRTCVRGFEDRGFWWGAVLELAVFGEEKWGAGMKSKRRPLGRGLSSYQLFRAALELLSKHDFSKEPLFVKTKDRQHRFSPEEYTELHEATFVDSSSLVNLLAGVSLGSLDLLRQDALKTLECLDQNSIHADPFGDVFLVDHRDLPTRFDTVLHVDLSTAKPHNTPLHTVIDSGSPSNALLSSLSSILRKGLGDRTKAITFLHAPSSPRPLAQAHPSTLNTIYIGLIHDSPNAYRLVDHGPAADEEDAEKVKAFRDLWGDKSELRRFKDGRIVESVVWDVKTADERAQIPGMIVRHLLKVHFGVTDSDSEVKVKSWQKDFDAVLRLPETVSSIYLESGVVTGVKGALNAFDDLVRKIKGLGDAIPLSVLNANPISEQLRYTSVFSPVPLPPKIAALLPANAKYVAPIEVLVEFEKSSRWPDDLKAIQKMKLAFFERLASELMSAAEGLTARVVVGDGLDSSEIRDQACLEVVNSDGWAFTMRIWVDREAVLLDRILEEKNKKVPPMLRQKKKEEDLAKARLYREAYEAKDLYTRRFIQAPRHHRAVAALSHQYSAFAGTVRLVKRWLASHWLLHGHISEEAAEILCAKFFVGDGRTVGVDMDSETNKERAMRASIPGSKERGFATVVQFLKDWKWTEGVTVPMYGAQTQSFRDEEDEGLQAKSKDAGAVAGNGVWRLETELDTEGRMWTRHGPDATVAQRVAALAKATWGLMQGMESGAFDVKSMFIHPTDDYDVLVRLDRAILPRYFNNIAVDANVLSRRGKYANTAAESGSSVVRPGFDPARLLFHDLQRAYTNTFKIFHDSSGGDRYGIVWDPSLQEPRPFRVLGQFSSIPVKKENEKAKEKNPVTLNDAAILDEVERLGSGLVKEIVVQVAA